MRGLGNWFFYGTDRLGDSIDQAHYYVTNHIVELFSFAVPVLALAAAAIVRWKHRTYFVLLIVVGTVIGAGAWPYDDTTRVRQRVEGVLEQLGAGAVAAQHPACRAPHRVGLRRAPRGSGVGDAHPAQGDHGRGARSRSSPSVRCSPCGATAISRAGSNDPSRCPRTGRTPRPRSTVRATRRGSSRSRARTSPRTGGATPSSR